MTKKEPCCPHCGKALFDRPGTLDEVLEHYLRSKGKGSRVTLKDVATITGLTYSYVRQAKTKYDREGNRGTYRKKNRVYKAKKRAEQETLSDGA